MPVVWQTASRTLQARTESSSEAAALHGERALTPIIAGTISGICVGTAWLVALIVILVKRYRRKQRYRKIGQDADAVRAAKEEEERRKAEFIVPPDPAVLQGSHLPGERVIVDDKRRWWKGRRRANSASGVRKKGKGREQFASVRRQSAPGPRQHSQSGHVEGQTAQINIIPPDEGETIELRPHPVFHKLSTIISVADSQRFASATASLHGPPSGNESRRSDVGFVSSDRDDNSLVHSGMTGENGYPPSRHPP